MMSYALVGFFDEMEKISSAKWKALLRAKNLSLGSVKRLWRTPGFRTPLRNTLRPAAPTAQAASMKRVTSAIPKHVTKWGHTSEVGLGGQVVSKPAKIQAYTQALAREGKVYRGAPGLESRLSRIGGHPRQATRTGAQVGRVGHVPGAPAAGAPSAPMEAGTVVAKPTARSAARASVNPYGHTVLTQPGYARAA